MAISNQRAKDWLAQAESDFLWAQDSFERKHFAQSCFIAQQIAEKALKALAYHRGYDQIKSHSATKIAKALTINGEIEVICKKLDLYYISSRYPDAFPEGAPFEYFTIDQACEAVGFAEKILIKVRESFKK